MGAPTRSRCSSKRVAASIAVLGDKVAATHPLAKIIETGSDPHTIEPKERVLKMADGRFVTGPVRPVPRETVPSPDAFPLWPELYRRNARGAFRGI